MIYSYYAKVAVPQNIGAPFGSATVAAAWSLPREQVVTTPPGLAVIAECTASSKGFLCPSTKAGATKAEADVEG